jgi:hypothetical protein
MTTLMSTVSLPPGLIHATRNPDLTSCSGLKVLIRLLQTLNTSEFKRVQTWFVADQLHTDETTVRRALILLEELKYVERGARDGSCFTFRLREIESLSGPTTVTARLNNSVQKCPPFSPIL